MRIRFKRLIAFALDWNISLFPFMLAFGFLTTFLQHRSSIYPLIFLLCIFLILSAFMVFVLRDIIFKGRSLGKRMMGLYIYQNNSLQEANVKQRFLRNIFFFIYIFDGIILLTTGETIGDRVAGTVVHSKQSFELNREEGPNPISTKNSSPVSKKKKIKRGILLFTIIIGCLIVFVGSIQIILNAQKDTEEYKVAYSYFTESNAFKELNVDESKIRLNQYSSKTYTSANNNSVTQTVEIGFAVDFKSFRVICHKENGIWQVCTECTQFE